MGTYTDLAREVQATYGFSPRMALEFAMETRYHGADFTTASKKAFESSDRYYREQSQEIMEDLRVIRETNPEQFRGHSISVLSSIMTVLDCSFGLAKTLADLEKTHGDLDWSEATWEDIYSYFSALYAEMWDDYYESVKTDDITETQEEI